MAWSPCWVTSKVRRQTELPGTRGWGSIKRPPSRGGQGLQDWEVDGFRHLAPSPGSKEARVPLSPFSFGDTAPLQQTPSSPVLTQVGCCRLQSKALIRTNPFLKSQKWEAPPKKSGQKTWTSSSEKTTANQWTRETMSTPTCNPGNAADWKLIITEKASFIRSGNTFDYRFLKGNKQPPTSSNSSYPLSHRIAFWESIRREC